MVEYACMQKNAAIVLLSGDSHMRSAVLRCLSLGAYVHVVGIKDKISPSLTSISSLSFRVTTKDLACFDFRSSPHPKTMCSVKKARRICRWFCADNVPGKPVPATGTWAEGCSAYLAGLCPDVHPDQPEWKQILDQLPSNAVFKFPCNKGLFCKRPQSCGHGHSAYHLQHHRCAKCPPIKRKFNNCPRMDGCKFAHRPSQCSFLHPGEIRLCLWCNKQHDPDCFASLRVLEFAN
jgi:hypothetical protein